MTATPSLSSGVNDSRNSLPWTIHQSLDEPRQLILALLPKFKSSSDVSHVLSIKSQMNAMSDERQKILNAAMENLTCKFLSLFNN